MKTPPSFLDARIARLSESGPDLHALRLDLGDSDLASSHTVPGQYLQLRVGEEKPAFLAIASAPGDGPFFDLLVQRGGEAVDAAIAAGEGGRVQITAAAGRGFDLEPHRGRDLLLVGGGTGLSALRSVIRWSERLGGEGFGRRVLVHGVRTPAHFAWPEEHAAWREGGLEIHLVVSRAEGTGWSGPVGHVQAQLAEALADPAAAVACLCGRREMQDDVAAWLESRGMPAERILTNF